MENIQCLANPQDKFAFITSPSFLKTPSWGEFFYYASSRESLMDIYDGLLDRGFHSVEQPHEIAADIFVAKMMDPEGREILLRSR
jgi:hypothetical protein